MHRNHQYYNIKLYFHSYIKIPLNPSYVIFRYMCQPCPNWSCVKVNQCCGLYFYKFHHFLHLFYLANFGKNEVNVSVKSVAIKMFELFQNWGLNKINCSVSLYLNINLFKRLVKMTRMVQFTRLKVK